ncbi:hypothetical protein HKX42_09760 [Salinisphaera sp. USBA-960]|uniref:MAPEG family protein n=1 Tax=Salinisphaera orenii TaxID=856731 RepID=UPI000DBE8FAA|nr:hypothetical protein [Salifodinibacter halophilus]NNC27159.1 hypothetical protein [Salifodinibacter halophilus]
MLIAYWCVLIAAVMPIGFVGYAKFAGQRKLGPQANHDPRAWLERTEGAQRRAWCAQQNGFEAFPPFAAGVIIAAIAGAPAVAMNVLAVLFVLLRLLYGWCYISDRASLRSTVWFAATLCTVVLFFLPLFGSAMP